jgi:hypothetical protein
MFKGLTARRLYKSFGVKGLTPRISKIIQKITSYCNRIVTSVMCASLVVCQV